MASNAVVDDTDGTFVEVLKRKFAKLSSMSPSETDPAVEIPVPDRALLRKWYGDNHEHNERFTYTMSVTGGRKRGRVLIINNKKFTNPMYKRRDGTEKDKEALKVTLKFLGFSDGDVTTVNDQKAEQMEKLMKSMAKEDYSTYGCSVVAIFSHGEEDGICGTDKPIDVENLIKYFRDSPSLAGKPKIFILQCCQGTMLNSGMHVYCSDGPGGRKFRKIAAGSDMIIAWSTLPGEFAFRSDNGSWFIQSFCAVMDVAGKELEFQQSLTRVCHLVSGCHESQNNDPELNHKKQSPIIMSTLTKELYFS